MERAGKKMSRRIEDLDTDAVAELLERCSMSDFIGFVKDKQIDGRKLMNITEGIVKLWRPKSNANKFIMFVQDLKIDPEKYLDYSKKDPDIDDFSVKASEIIHVQIEKASTDVMNKECTTVKAEEESKTIVNNFESQYQTVKKTKDIHITSLSNVEDLIKKIVPAKSFLYRNPVKKETIPSYLPMDVGTPKKRKLFRISGYDYPKIDLRRFSKQDSGDRGYYPMKRNSRFFIQKSKLPESRPKYKSLSSTEELKYPEDHFYEDLCYNDVEKEERNSVPSQNVKPYRVKIQELFQSFKIPFFKKTEDLQEDKSLPDTRIQVEVKDGNYYENTESIVNMYDSVHVIAPVNETEKSDEKPKLPVEEYLEPVKVNKDYCDVNYHRQKDESLLGYIMSIFENRFGMRRETNVSSQSDDSEDDKTIEEPRRWSEDHKPKTSMADRPLPVPIENEPYYMDIDRTEAENLLKGHPDGTFVLRPSSQSTHAYTISVSCTKMVHNVGVRRRADGRLALGFARRGERSFADVTSLLRHHKKRRLLLVANGAVIGATTLNECPQYYQTPCNLPVKVEV